MTKQTDDDDGFEERADQLTDEQIRTDTIVQDHFDEVNRALVSKGLTLIVGPRGCGKTHMMRFAAISCRQKASAPFAVYVSFNRYLRLEPLLSSRSDAITLFHSWVLALIALACAEALAAVSEKFGKKLWITFPVSHDEVRKFVERVERGTPTSDVDQTVIAALSIQTIKDLIRDAAELADRRRSIVLLDDAALTLTPEYLIEFFDIVRVLKASDISPKASVYPGTTEYGPRFHADHEGRSVPVWLSVTEPRYLDVMRDIGQRRLAGSDAVPEAVAKSLMYAAFGVPRAYLTMMRAWMDKADTTSEQAVLNQLIRDHRDARISEFKSLALKLPKLSSLVTTGVTFFASLVDVLRDANADSTTEGIQLQVGINADGFDPLTNRMLNLLIEAGLVREEAEVSHGPDRRLRRISPHVGALIADRAIFKGRGGGARLIVDALGGKKSKHPVRRVISRLIDQGSLESLRYDLPPCQHCQTPRLNDTQRFCHACGKKLLDGSTFTRCMALPISEIPNLSQFTQEALRERKIETIGSLVTMQDPGSELRKARGVGPHRSSRVLERVNDFVDEFLS
ncbi:zinc ribbon domain-containing protein [Sphingobium sp. D43FB]|uniref:ORC-CDC6 family AAA ATPase n=1 Tax=Sphingobium sp. D43FB TaxID=2017595 RepID=UPI001143A9CA|nr:zinc ribbon domain-containing protein [Sphingobium sp. D43FB]